MGGSNGKGEPTGEDPIKKWTIAILTAIFVGFYVYAIYGVWHDEAAVTAKAISLLQPIVYVIIGYYFGRLPSERTEKQLKDEAREKGKQADDANSAASQALTKLQSVKTILLGTGAADSNPKASGFVANLAGAQPNNLDTLKISVAHAINIIDQ